MASQNVVMFHDFFSFMLDKMGAQGFMKELSNGYQFLMDKDKWVITFDSLKRNVTYLGLQDLRDDELMCMLKERDLDGDGALNQMEFCILIFRLSPGLIRESKKIVVGPPF
ncbi:hypothetical protein GIB67_023670 [Kingdonia uniflora]|uniref:EF-hand domain-containing protein n=1 Tax=Kingdonia uniflora TaxID=39325 RepID=A0A7J7MG50_9MAGN|nr:hypothetical protein GIB67_023670 [Kingdonia uniflora]